MVQYESHGSAGDESFKFLTYQLPTVGYWPTVAMTGNGELGFDSGEYIVERPDDHGSDSLVAEGRLSDAGGLGFESHWTGYG